MSQYTYRFRYCRCIRYYRYYQFFDNSGMFGIFGRYTVLKNKNDGIPSALIEISSISVILTRVYYFVVHFTNRTCDIACTLALQVYKSRKKTGCAESSSHQQLRYPKPETRSFCCVSSTIRNNYFRLSVVPTVVLYFECII